MSISVIVKSRVRGIIADKCPDPEGLAQGRGQLSRNNSESCHGLIFYTIATILNSVKDQLRIG